MRAVLTTAAVAALGFCRWPSRPAPVPVQRPLATAVIFGIAYGTLFTLTVFRDPVARLPGYRAPSARTDEYDPARATVG